MTSTMTRFTLLNLSCLGAAIPAVAALRLVLWG
jgi:hypothetical protein